MIPSSLAEALQKRIDTLEAEKLNLQRSLTRAENGLSVAMATVDHLSTKLYGRRNSHPDADTCGCEECKSVG